ncbi:MAG: transcription-repair coupling factor [Thioalkalivibrionaceae bacterium]
MANPQHLASALIQGNARHALEPGRLPQDGFQRWTGLNDTASVAALTAADGAFDRPMIVVTESMEAVDRFVEEFETFISGRPNAPKVLRLPDWETLPYDWFSPHEEIISERLRTLSQLTTQTHCVLVVAVSTLIQRLPPPSWLVGAVFSVKVGERLDRLALRDRFVAAGYRHTGQVTRHGEIAGRGEILDIFPMGAEAPIRIEFLDDEIDSLRRFDAESQRSTEPVDAITLLPSHEFPFDETAIRDFRNRYRARLPGDPSRHPIYSEVSEGRAPPGIEAFLALFFDDLATLFDYMPNAVVVQLGDIAGALQSQHDEILERFSQLSHQIERPLLPPETLYLGPEELKNHLRARPGLAIGREPKPVPEDRGESRRVAMLPAVGPAQVPNAAGGQDFDPRALEALLTQFPRIIISTESAGRRELLVGRLRNAEIPCRLAADWQEAIKPDPETSAQSGRTERAQIVLLQGALRDGFAIAGRLLVLPESRLTGERARVNSRRRRKATRDAEAVIQDLSDLAIGAPVVHAENGIGRYRGLETLDIGGQTTEFLLLEYADEAKLYVPVSSLHLISRYTGADAEHAPLHRLGSDQWAKARKKAAEKAFDVAAELLEIHARRAAKAGESQGFEINSPEYEAFAAAFPFDPTPDQQKAIDATLADMAKREPMDRVVCGDVGFGKTEVAMRAAFIATQNGRQVAVLVPTTLLAQQHYQNFLDRFADWPVKIESLSRFRSTREQKQVLEGLRDGTVDIVIGTHKLLSKEIAFKRLGLVIVDEEQRFGVRHKEALKKLRAEVDLLTLTATPIPRTLNMALSGLRELSIIATPPSERLAIQTFVQEWNDALVQEACMRELRRGGQVYLLHNDVDTIGKMAEQIQVLVPQARIDIAHGQMPERDLERVMLDFVHRRINILICTTIIETGIDVPTANTIIMNRADRLGLAQMHQLRGRVGRSHHRAYAYLITPPERTLTPDAKKRLDAISALEDLGVGFTLASHDLEIRGAGELLGDEQSGQIQEIGFTLYNDLLRRAVRALKSGDIPDTALDTAPGTEVELGAPARLPDDYVPDIHTRLILYKRLSSAADADALSALREELTDRFGKLPDAAENLIVANRLRLRLTPLGVRKAELASGGGRLRFGARPRIDVGALIERIQREPKIYQFDGSTSLRFTLPLDTIEKRVNFLERLLHDIAPPSSEHKRDAA